MRVLWNCAMRWELTEIGENPMKLVRVRGTSKRQREPMVLGVAQIRLLLGELDEPFRTMVILDLATGLRCSELFALKWCDVLWDDLNTARAARHRHRGSKRCQNQILQCGHPA